MASDVCFFGPCNGKDACKTVRMEGIKTTIKCSKERCDNETHAKLQDIIAKEGESATIQCHKSCYCSYTSKSNIAKSMGKLRREGFVPEEDNQPPNRVRRSQVSAFSFSQHCLFCGNECLPKNPKHAGRWKKVVQCRTSYRPGMPSFKDSILAMCSQRSDDYSKAVEIRLKGALSDLHAVDAQYHKQCYDDFYHKKPETQARADTQIGEETALNDVIRCMEENKSVTWTSDELFHKYKGSGGTFSRKAMMTNIFRIMGEDILMINLQGCNSVVGFRTFIGKTIKLVKADPVEDEVNEMADSLAQLINSESKTLEANNTCYNLSDFNHDRIVSQISPTLLKLISKLISNGKISKKSISLSQAIQYNITGYNNQTTIGLAVKLHHMFGSSELIRILNSHGFVVTYDEILRFRKSTAKYVSENINILHQSLGLSESNGPIYGWFDNLDIVVSTPNGRRDSHLMAHEFQQSPKQVQNLLMNISIPRLSQQDARSAKVDKMELKHYTGPKRSNPPVLSNSQGIPYATLQKREQSLAEAERKDIMWLCLNDTCEWNGFNTQIARDEKNIIKPPTVFLFGPLIDAKPSHPDTVYTSMVYMTKSITDLGMTYASISIDMQLYMIAVQIKWAEPEKFKNVILRPGAMHILMSFLGCIGSLMAGSGLEDIIKAAFGGIKSIMNGKSWVRAMRAFRMTTVAIIQPLLATCNDSFVKIEEDLEAARKSPTGRHWVDNLIRPTLLAHQFLRSEREGDWDLQQLCLQRMLVYFFGAGHCHYARFITWHLMEMKHLPEAARKDLEAGAHVCRQEAGLWNSVSADQFGEQTAIRIGKGGLKGMTLSPDLVAEWVDAFPITSFISKSMEDIYSNDNMTKAGEDETKHMKHKEEGTKRKKLDQEDQQLICDEVAKYQNPLSEDLSNTSLMNIVNGKLANENINVEKSLEIADEIMRTFSNTLPDGFHSRIPQKVKTMEQMKKGIQIRNQTIYDLEEIFLRLLLVGQQRHIELEPLFNFELCAVPASIMDEYGFLRKGQKSTLVNKLAEITENPENADLILIDAQQLLYHIVWPCEGTVADLADSIKQKLLSLGDAEKILIFDKYEDVVPKDHERQRRNSKAVEKYVLSINSRVPNREAIMNSKDNKRELSRVLSMYNYGEKTTTDTKSDGAYEHDEADVTIISYMIQAADTYRTIRILSDDSDIFVLMVYWAYTINSSNFQMQRWNGTILNINNTVRNLGAKSLQLLPMHALTGCDTVSFPFGKGKVSALKILLSNDIDLDTILGEVDSSEDQLLQTASYFFSALYGMPGEDIHKVRYKLYTKQKGKTRIQSLPPTKANLKYHVKRAHYQALIWKAADRVRPPAITNDITKFGWEIKNNQVVPEYNSGPAAPEELVDVISCSCKVRNSGQACSSEMCSCRKAGLSCTYYCICGGKEQCNNPNTTASSDEEHAE